MLGSYLGVEQYDGESVCVGTRHKSVEGEDDNRRKDREKDRKAAPEMGLYRYVKVSQPKREVV